MTWPTPRTWTDVELVDETMFNAEIRDRMNLLKTSINDGGHLSPPAATTLTLAGDACTPTQNLHKVDTEAAAAADNLSTLTIAGNVRDGHALILLPANVAHVVTVKNGVGNITLRGGDYAMDHASRALVLQLSGTTWIELSRSGARGEINVVSKSTTYTMTDADDVVLATGTFVVTLPSVTLPAKRPRTVKNVSTGTITVTPASGLIDGEATFDLSVQNQSATFVPDGTNWSII